MAVNEEDLIKIQTEINQLLYEEIADHYETASFQTNPSMAIGIIISALSTNLGSILAQIPDAQREKYLSISKEILDLSFSAAVEDVSANRWGAVGHA
jgi:hypothetical protein